MSDGLQPLIDDVRDAVHCGAGSIPPDFAAALARAHELAPERFAVSIDVDDPAVIDIRGGDRGTASAEAVLDTMVHDSRAAVLRMVAEQRMRSIPSAPLPARRRSASRWILGGMLAAAAAVAAIGGYRFVELARERQDAAPADQAFHLEATEQADGSVVQVEPAPSPVAPKPKAASSLGPAPLERTVGAPEHESAKSIVRRAAGLDHDNAGRARDREDKMRTLSSEAHALWKKGDLRGAERRFETIANKGGKSVQVELAWADLFSLARQSGDASRRTARWKAYLSGFPRGRFADDARAGLCRASNDAKCWSAYLRDLPNGSYRAEAEFALAHDGAP